MSALQRALLSDFVCGILFQSCSASETFRIGRLFQSVIFVVAPGLDDLACRLPQSCNAPSCGTTSRWSIQMISFSKQFVQTFWDIYADFQKIFQRIFSFSDVFSEFLRNLICRSHFGSSLVYVIGQKRQF